MKTRDKNRRMLLVCCLIGLLLLLPSILPARNYYDVSYLWTKDIQSAKEYALKIKRVLGPNAARKIEVVRSKSNRYGVIYDRDGDYQTVLRLALYHARLLKRSGITTESGLSAACPIRDSGYWPIKKRYSKTIQKPNLTSSLDSRLEADIDRYIKRLRRRGILSKTDRTSFVVYDISMQKKMASINEDEPIMAASLIKNFVMLAYFHQVKHNRLRHTSLNRLHLRRMIQRSSNPSTNYFIRLLGGPRNVTRILRSNYPYFEQTRIVEYIPRGGRTYRNTTSAHDLNRFYNQLWLGNLPYSEKMKYYLGLPNRDRIHTNTRIPKGVKVYNKTGTVYGMVGDSGVLVIKDSKGRQRAYAFTGMIEDKTRTHPGNRTQPFPSWVKSRENILRRVSEGVYEYIYEIHYDGKFRYSRRDGLRMGS
ncbi:MAG: serine hydrolase [Candidatus Poribacteria bacterium]